MSTNNRDKPKPGSELIREQARYWRERAAMCLDNTPKTEREYRNKAAALNTTADAYDAMLAACEKALSDECDECFCMAEYGKTGDADAECSHCLLKAALALAKPK